jgi:lantibiotic biosynthesis protein
VTAAAERAGHLDPELGRRTLDAAFELGPRLLEAAGRGEGLDEDWRPNRSFAGYPGYALAFMALAQATGESRYEAAMHDFIRRAARIRDLPELGLFGGISGLRAVCALATRVEPRYAELAAQCDAHIAARLPHVPVHPVASFVEYDVIGGWAGIRLAQCIDGPRKRDAAADALAWLLEDDERWRCPHPVRGGEPTRDLGLAHGMPGMLAALALTLEEPGDLREPIARAASDLVARAIHRDGVVWWPYTKESVEPPRAAWCYGMPGVAAALHAAALLLGDETLAAFAVEALASLERVEDAACIVDEANLCHGTLGNALCVASVSARTGSPALRRLVHRYTASTLDRLEAEGWRCMSRQDDGRKYDTYNELVGSAGIVLGLLTLAGEFEGTWMRAHALNPIS